MWLINHKRRLQILTVLQSHVFPHTPIKIAVGVLRDHYCFESGVFYFSGNSSFVVSFERVCFLDQVYWFSEEFLEGLGMLDIVFLIIVYLAFEV